jgi:uncharacterized protein
MKRKYGNRSDWKRVIKRKYSQSYLETNRFKGYITLLNIMEVTEPLWVRYGDKKVCIVDNGYMWLQQFPLDKHHSVTTMFDEKGDIVQWYIDICFKNSVEDRIPWMDDLYLDLVLLPTGEVIIKDTNELEEALEKGLIDKPLYDLAWNELNYLKRLVREDNFDLIKLSCLHKDSLLDQLE